MTAQLTQHSKHLPVVASPPCPEAMQQAASSARMCCRVERSALVHSCRLVGSHALGVWDFLPAADPHHHAAAAHHGNPYRRSPPSGR